MKLKNAFVSALSALTIFAFAGTTQAVTATNSNEAKYEVKGKCEYVNPNYCGNNSLTNGLDSNQTTLFYMYSNKEGHYFLDPLADTENVIYVGRNDYLIDDNFTIDTKTLHHGKRFVGTFDDNSLWELIEIQEVEEAK